MSDQPKYVYSFGGGKADGKAEMKTLLGGKGANLAEMSVIGIPVPPGFTITTEVCAAYYENGKKLPEAAVPQIQAAIKQMEALYGAKFGDPSDPLLVSRPLGGGALHARHDEHDPEPGPDRRLGRGRGQEDRQRPVRLRRLSPPDRHVRLDRDGRRARAVRARAPHAQARKGRQARHRAFGRRPQGAGQAVQGRLQEARRRGLPAGPEQAAHAVDQRRVQLVERQQGDRVSPHRADHRPEGHGRQRAGDGLRQHGRDLRHRRRLHPRPEHRRERLLRRLPHQRPGRGRGRRHPHARADRAAPAGHAQGLRPADGDPPEAGAALQGDAGHRVHRAGRHPVHAPDPHRQAAPAPPPSGSPSRW